jgi:hypothetical protein
MEVLTDSWMAHSSQLIFGQIIVYRKQIFIDMKNISLLFAVCLSVMMLFSCHRKTVPSHSANTTSANKNATVSKPKEVDSSATKPAMPKAKPATAKVIVVSDAAAKKTVDGRYYYDLSGKRYWRNNKDGKYYLFNKSMYNDPDFKPVQSN